MVGRIYLRVLPDIYAIPPAAAVGLQDTEPAEPSTSVQDTITGPTSADVQPSGALDAQTSRIT